MFAFLEKVNKLDDSAPSEEPKIDPDDPYPWLEKDDPRQTMTNMECIKKFINLNDSVLTPENKEHFRKILLKYKDAFSLHNKVGGVPLPQSACGNERHITILCTPIWGQGRPKEVGGQGNAERLSPRLHEMRNVLVQQSHHAHSKEEFKRAGQDSGRFLGAEFKNCQHQPEHPTGPRCNAANWFV